MNEQELKERIAEHIFHEVHPHAKWGVTGTVDDNSWRRFESHCYQSADQIIALIKEVGYVNLADDQGLPPENNKCIMWDLYQKGWLEAQQNMRIVGWRKIEVEEPPCSPIQ